MHRFQFSTGILSPINSDISLNESSLISPGSLQSPATFNETETSLFEPVKDDSRLDSLHERGMKESTAAGDVSKDKKNINVEKEIKFKESYKMLKQSMDELAYNKYAPSSVLSPVSSDADLEKGFGAKHFLQSSVLSPVSNDMNVEKVTETKDTLPEIKSDKNAPVLKSKTSSKSGSAEYKSSQRSNSKLRKKKDGSARNSKGMEDNQQSKCTDPAQTSPKEMKKNLKRLELQPEGKEATKLTSSVTKLQNNHKDSKKSSSSVQSHEVSAGSGSKEKENLKHYYSQKQKKSTVSSGLSISEIQNLSIEKSIELNMSMEMDRLRGFIYDQNMSLRKNQIKLQETVERQNDVIERQNDIIQYLLCAMEDLKAENKKLKNKS